MTDGPKYKETLDPLKKKRAYMVNNSPWCQVCNFPHSQDHCVVAQSIQEEELPYDNEEEDVTLYQTSRTLHLVEEEYSSSEDEGFEYDVNNQR